VILVPGWASVYSLAMRAGLALVRHRLLVGAAAVVAVAGGCSSGPKLRALTIEGRAVEIVEPGAPADAALSIDGRAIPLEYDAGFAGWRACGLFAAFPDLARLAEALIGSDPELQSCSMDDVEAASESPACEADEDCAQTMLTDDCCMRCTPRALARADERQRAQKCRGVSGGPPRCPSRDCPDLPPTRAVCADRRCSLEEID
jgi:hypothetical protein